MIQRILDLSVRGLFGGARRGQPVVTALSAGTALIAFMVKRRRPAKELLYGVDLKEGEAVHISFWRNDTVVQKTEIEG